MTELNQWLYGVNRSAVRSYQQEKQVVMPADATINIIEPKITTTVSTRRRGASFMESDIETLIKEFGDLTPGKEITMELSEACELLGRTRKRIDAFKKLSDTLMSEYNVKLIIKSRKNHGKNFEVL